MLTENAAIVKLYSPMEMQAKLYNTMEMHADLETGL